ncbi:MAG: caspase family protein [Candidatus Helarchaeota archaeon]
MSYFVPSYVRNRNIDLEIKSNEINRYALVIGISDYPGYINDLSYCDDDAISIKTWLTNQNFPNENIYVLIDRQATRSNIEEKINLIKSQCDGDDYFFFFYSGHGDQHGSTTSIIPYDYNLNGEITETDLKGYFNTINYSKLIALFDSCRSGGLLNSINGTNRIIITACSATEDSIEDIFTLKHGIFTAFFLKAYENLNADANNDTKITLEEAFNYLYEKSASYSSNVYGYTQHAQMYDSVSGEFMLSPYLEVLYTPNHYGINNIAISINSIGFDEIIDVNFTIYLNNIEYQDIFINNVNQTSNLLLELPIGTYEFQLSTIYNSSDNNTIIYHGQVYELNVLSFFQSNMGFLIIIISIISSIGFSIAILIIYKQTNYFKLRLKVK